LEDREDAQVLIGAETMVSAGRHERGVTFPKLQLLSVDVKHPASLKDDVELVVGVHTLMVWLRSDKRVDTDLEPSRFVDDLVTAVSGAKARPRSGDVEGVGRIQLVALQFQGLRSDCMTLPPSGLFAALPRRCGNCVIAFGRSHAQRMNSANAFSYWVAHPFLGMELLKSNRTLGLAASSAGGALKARSVGGFKRRVGAIAFRGR
jgi:hypothetical protein